MAKSPRREERSTVCLWSLFVKKKMLQKFCIIYVFTGQKFYAYCVLCVGYICNISIVFEKIVKTIGKLRNFKKFYRILTIVFFILILKKHCTFSVLRLENFKQNFTLYIFTMHKNVKKSVVKFFMGASSLKEYYAI